MLFNIADMSPAKAATRNFDPIMSVTMTNKSKIDRGDKSPNAENVIIEVT